MKYVVIFFILKFVIRFYIFLFSIYQVFRLKGFMQRGKGRTYVKSQRTKLLRLCSLSILCVKITIGTYGFITDQPSACLMISSPLPLGTIAIKSYNCSLVIFRSFKVLLHCDTITPFSTNAFKSFSYLLPSI